MYSGRSFNVGLGLLEDALALREGAFDLSDFDFVIAARLFKLRFDRRRAARFFKVQSRAIDGGRQAAGGGAGEDSGVWNRRF